MHSSSLKLKLFSNKCDVFFGQEGWEPWARFQLKKTKTGVFITQIAGDRVPSHIFKYLVKEFNNVPLPSDA